MFGHATVGNKSLGEYVLNFALSGDISSLSVVSINMDITFASDGNKIRLLIAEVLLRAANGNLARLKNQQDWTPRNPVLLPPFLNESAILHMELDAGELLNILLVPSRSGRRKGKLSAGKMTTTTKTVNMAWMRRTKRR